MNQGIYSRNHQVLLDDPSFWIIFPHIYCWWFRNPKQSPWMLSKNTIFFGINYQPNRWFCIRFLNQTYEMFGQTRSVKRIFWVPLYNPYMLVYIAGTLPRVPNFSRGENICQWSGDLWPPGYLRCYGPSCCLGQSLSLLAGYRLHLWDVKRTKHLQHLHILLMVQKSGKTSWGW